MDTQTQIERLIELAIVQRGELRKLVGELPQLREHLNAEIERVFEETEPQLRVELEEFVAKQAQERSDAISAELKAKIDSFAKTLNQSAEAKYSALVAERAKNDDLLKQAEQNIAFAAQALPAQVKEIVTAELARFPRAGEIDQLRKEFAEPKGLNPRGKWSGAETYNRLDLVSYNGDSFVSNTDGNKEKPSRQSAAWTLNAARGVGGGGGGVTSLTDLVPVPANGQVLIGNGSGFVENTLTAGTGVTITNGPGTITIDATGAQELLTATVKNAESTPITKGQVVYLYSATGNLPSVKLAFNTSDATSAKTFGIVSSTSIAANGTGTVTCVGVVDGLNLGSYNDGDTVYLGATAGTITVTKPYAPNHLVYVGIIQRANAGNGQIYVKVQNGYELDEIHDVQITSAPAAGALLMRDATNSLWKANRLSAGTNIAVTNADTSVTIGLTGTVAVANGGTGVTSSTGTGSVVLSNTPTLVTPVIGAATGTSLALTGSVTAPDHIFGTSGPSAKSSIAARAARQGLVGNGTAESTATLGSALGSTDKSLAVTVLVNEAGNGIFHFGTSNATVARQLQVLLLNTRKLRVELLGATTSDIRQANTDSAIADNGKFAHVVCTISGSTLTIYVNGVSVSYTEVTAGTPPAWSDAVNGTAVEIGGTAGANLASTTLETPYVYNRALTAAEVVSLYEAGVPSGADYNSASNTALNVATFANSNIYPYGTFSGASTTGFTAVSNGTGFQAAFANTSITFKTGTKYRLTYTLTLNSGAAPFFVLGNPGVAGYSTAVQLSAGTNSVEVTATGSGTSAQGFGFQHNSSAGNYAISNISLVPLGLLLAPDAAQAGGGLTWYDTSGNAANIILPASGVTWNVPTSGKMATSLTIGGTGVGLTLAPSSGAASMTLNGPAAGSAVNFALTGTNKYTAEYVNGSDFFAIGRSGVAYDLVLKSGNVLVGTTTDGGQKLQVAGTAAITGAVSIGNTVTTGVSVASTHKVQISIGGTTYYLLASNV